MDLLVSIGGLYADKFKDAGDAIAAEDFFDEDTFIIDEDLEALGEDGMDMLVYCSSKIRVLHVPISSTVSFSSNVNVYKSNRNLESFL